VVLGLLTVVAAGGTAQAQSRGHDRHYDDTSSVVRCESIRNRTQECRIDGRAKLIRQLSGSACIEGKSWGPSRNGVWVTQGCRAEFVGESGRRPGHGNGGHDRPWNNHGNGNGRGQVIQCDSNDRRERRCNVTIRRDARLLKQNSGSACIEGRTWGYDRDGVWVNGGCRGQFLVN